LGGFRAGRAGINISQDHFAELDRHNYETGSQLTGPQGNFLKGDANTQTPTPPTPGPWLVSQLRRLCHRKDA
jgi:hypothetical protein